MAAQQAAAAGGTEDTRKLLSDLGIGSADELFAEIPPELRWERPLRLPEAPSEVELSARLAELAIPNTHLDEAVCFLGGGVCDHYVPAVVDAVAAAIGPQPIDHRSPQRLLQLVFELQALFAELTGLEAALAPFADAPTALAQAICAALRATRRQQVVVTRSLHPRYRAILRTMLAGTGVELAEAGYHGGVTRPDQAEHLLSDQVACLVVQHPNYFGCLEDVRTLADAAHRHGALLAVVADPISLGLLALPGEAGADVAVADAQPLGFPASWGGSLGLLACRGALVEHAAAWRVERNGGGFAAVGEAREPLRAGRVARPAVYLAAVGGEGLRRAASLSVARAHEAQRRICAVEGFDPRFRAPFFKEFVVESAAPPEDVAEELLQSNILGALPLQADYPEMDHCSLFAATERRTPTDITMLAHALDVMIDLSEELEDP